MGRTSDARQRLLDASFSLIWEQGYSAVGVEAICCSAGVRKGSFYYYFTSKAELVATAIESHWQGFRPQLDGLFDPSLPPLVGLQNYFTEIYRFSRERQQRGDCLCGCPYFDLGSEVATLEPEVSAMVRQVLAEFRGYFYRAIDRAASLGQLTISDPEAATRWLFNYFEGALMAARIHNDAELLADLWPGARQLLGVRTAA